MKIVIDIPESDFDWIRDEFSDGELPDSISLTATTMYAIAKGTVLTKNATNGDVMRALFDGTVLMTNTLGVGYKLKGCKNGYMPWFDTDWWNAPYKENDTDGNS